MSGSERSANSGREDYAVEGVGRMRLHHLYRMMPCLGELLDDADVTTGSPRCVKNRAEKALLAHRRAPFSMSNAVFWDTTSLYREGASGSPDPPRWVNSSAG